MKSAVKKFFKYLLVIILISGCNSQNPKSEVDRVVISSISADIIEESEKVANGVLPRDKMCIYISNSLHAKTQAETLFIGTAKAESVNLSSDSIVDLRVVSLYNYDTERRAGSDITSCFYFNEITKPHTDTDEKTPLTQYSQLLSVKANRTKYENLKIHPLTLPKADTQQFKIIMRFSTGRELMAITKKIKLR
ncbi:MAG: hypothetical protein NTX03_02170 [Bacteroidetes bacterium]|nr:hypothetical protein [Bacteroidota bacterium]